MHAWDLATALNRPFTPKKELTLEMATFAESFITEDIRGDFDGAPYAAPSQVPEGATDGDRLIAFTGRNPNWPL